jgi:hypothetical protein
MTRIGDRVSLRAAFTALVLVAGCEVQRPARSEAELKERRETLVKEMLDGRVALSRSVVARGIAEQDAEKTTGAPACLDMLILSGGGDYGAFGAGVLKGWGQVSGDMARPEFDVVTGVSTGALIAPLAFVGSEDAYERAFQVFQNPKPQWFRDRGLFAILIEKASLTDNTGLRQDMETTIDEAMIREIASGHEQSRVLLIGTTNIDMGMLTMWDVGKIAHDIISEGKRRDPPRRCGHGIGLHPRRVPSRGDRWGSLRRWRRDPQTSPTPPIRSSPIAPGTSGCGSTRIAPFRRSVSGSSSTTSWDGSKAGRRGLALAHGADRWKSPFGLRRSVRSRGWPSRQS